MKVGVLSGSIEAGGAQRVCLKMVETLKEANHEVTLITLTKSDWPKVQKMLGEVIKPDKEIVLLTKNFRGFDAYKPLFAALAIRNLRRKLQFDLLINSQADILPIEADILYVHYPTFSEYESVGINPKYSKSLFWRLYIAPYKLVHRCFKNYLKAGVLLTNSSYSKKAIREYTGRNSIVIFPPVEVETFTKASQEVAKENGVVSCGRYSPEKNYESVIEVAKRLGDIKFVVVGSFSGKKSSLYYDILSRIISGSHLTNVSLLHGLRFDDLLRRYGKAKVYMHAMKNEHFGMTVVEGMAAGLVPVVYRGGGPWEDILRARQGYYGFSYESPEEATIIIRMLIKDESLRKQIVARNQEYVEQFSVSHFKENFMKLVNRVLEVTSSASDP